jgi:hypothetical protein
MSPRTYLHRDPFARTTLVRDYEKETTENCSWCGGRSNHGGLFQYGIEHDGGRYDPITGLFCSKSCMEAYHV